MGKTVLEMRSIEKSFGKTRALRGIDFEVEEGEVGPLFMKGLDHEAGGEIIQLRLMLAPKAFPEATSGAAMAAPSPAVFSPSLRIEAPNALTFFSAGRRPRPCWARLAWLRRVAR